MKKKLIIPIWIICSVFSYSCAMGSFTHNYPYQNNYGIAILMGIWGPVGLFVCLVEDHPFHFRLKALTSEERWEVFHEMNPELSRDYFERKYN